MTSDRAALRSFLYQTEAFALLSPLAKEDILEFLADGKTSLWRSVRTYKVLGPICKAGMLTSISEVVARYQDSDSKSTPTAEAVENALREFTQETAA
jgi:hypothetical protein